MGEAEDAVRRHQVAEETRRAEEQRARYGGRGDERATLEREIAEEIPRALDRLKRRDYVDARMVRVRRAGKFGRVFRSDDQVAGWPIETLEIGESRYAQSYLLANGNIEWMLDSFRGYGLGDPMGRRPPATVDELRKVCDAIRMLGT